MFTLNTTVEKKRFRQCFFLNFKVFKTDSSFCFSLEIC